MLDIHTQEFGYTEIAPPILVKDDAMFGTAQLPKFRDEQFAVPSTFLSGPVDKLEVTWGKTAFFEITANDRTWTIHLDDHQHSVEVRLDQVKLNQTPIGSSPPPKCR